MKKYRIKYSNGKVTDPIDENGLFELFESGHLTGGEEYQDFPLGSWRPLAQNQTFVQQIEQRLNKLRSYNKKKEKLEKIVEKDEKDQFVEFRFERRKVPRVENEEIQKDEKTIVRERTEESQVNENTNTREINSDKTSSINELKEKRELFPVINPHEETQVVDLQALIRDAQALANESEQEFEKKILEESLEEEAGPIQNEPLATSKKPMKPIVFFTFLVVLYFLIFDDKDKNAILEPRTLNIPMIRPTQVENSAKAAEEFRAGFEKFQTGQYDKKVLALNHFMTSLALKTKENPALKYIVFLCGDMFENINPTEENMDHLFTYLNSANYLVLSDELVAVGHALLYMKLNKLDAAEKIIENFLRVNDKKGSALLYSTYMTILKRLGKIDGAKQILENLESTETNALPVLMAMNEMYQSLENPEKQEALFLKNKDKYQTNAEFLIRYGILLVQKKEFDRLPPIIEALQLINCERSPYFFSYFLELRGSYFAHLGKIEEASGQFKLALKLNPRNYRLKYLLSELNSGGGDITQSLIREAKIDVLVLKSKEAVRSLNWDEALKLAIEAAELDPSSIIAKTHLADLQIRRGYIELATATLEGLYKEYGIFPPKIPYLLVKSYIDSFKFSNAGQLLSQLKDTSFGTLPEFSSITGYYYFKRDDINRTNQFLRDAIRRQQTNDQNYYWLAQIFLRYNKIKLADEAIRRAIDLDPVNPYYKIIKARIIKEYDGPGNAIGYLLEALESDPDNPILLGELAYFYFKEQKFQLFNERKEQLEKLPNKTGDLYSALMKSALYEENLDKVIEYGQKLIILEPGLLDTYITLGKTFLKIKREEKAIEMFNLVRARIQNYPLVHYWLAVANLELKDLNAAEQLAIQETKLNPSREEGHYLLGEILRQKGNLKEAEEHFVEALKINSQYPDVLLAIARIKRSKGESEGAIESLNRARVLDPSNPQIYRVLGEVYQDIGQPKIAIENFNLYLKLYPNAPDQSAVKAIIQGLTY